MQAYNKKGLTTEISMVDRAWKRRLGSENVSGVALRGCRCSPVIVRWQDEQSGCLQGLAVSASSRR
jgi:hypothetical protein